MDHGLHELGKQSSSSEANESSSDVIVTKLVAVSIRLVLDDNFDGNRRVGLVFPDLLCLYLNIVHVGNAEKTARRRPESIKTKQDWQERFKNIRFKKKEVQESDKTDDPTMPTPIFDENLFIPRRSPQPKESEGSLLSSDDLDVDIIPSASVLRQLAIGVEYMLNFQYAFPQISVVIWVFGY
ncbi:hypothetical protein Tco_0241365 [Tanacetum coccineum]